jgi:hypothetical protein
MERLASEGAGAEGEGLGNKPPRGYRPAIFTHYGRVGEQITGPEQKDTEGCPCIDQKLRFREWLSWKNIRPPRALSCHLQRLTPATIGITHSGWPGSLLLPSRARSTMVAAAAWAPLASHSESPVVASLAGFENLYSWLGPDVRWEATEELAMQRSLGCSSGGRRNRRASSTPDRQ